MPRADSLEKTLLLGKTENRRRKGRQRMRWLVASPTRWTWVWAGSGSWWWTGKPGVLQSMGSQRVGHNWATEQQQQIWDICFFWMVITNMLLNHLTVNTIVPWRWPMEIKNALCCCCNHVIVIPFWLQVQTRKLDCKVDRDEVCPQQAYFWDGPSDPTSWCSHPCVNTSSYVWAGFVVWL